MNAEWLKTICLTVALVCCKCTAAMAQIHGAGATFPAPLYAEWGKAYAQAGGEILRYDAVGSGQGIERIRRREVDFGATDVPLTEADLLASGLMQFPTVIGAVVPVVNISGVKPGALKLDAALLADIYLGRIRKWSDARIAELNPALHLPDANITVVNRSDSSGTSLLWSKYLAYASAEWRTHIGVALLPAWPAGVGGVGNEGVASYVQRTRFAIGYVEYTYARDHNLSDVSLRNSDGFFVRAQPETFRAAAQNFNWNDLGHIRQLQIASKGAASWPITAASFILIPTMSAHGAHTLEVLRFFDWALREGAPIASRLNYEAIPSSATAQLPALWRQTIHDDAGKSVWPF